MKKSTIFFSWNLVPTRLLRNLILCFFILISINSLQAQTKKVQYGTAERTTTTTVDNISSERYHDQLNSFSKKYVELTDLDDTNSTYLVHFTELGLKGIELEEVIKELSAKHPEFQNLELNATQTAIVVTVDNRKIKPTDLAHSFLWKNGLN